MGCVYEKDFERDRPGVLPGVTGGAETVEEEEVDAFEVDGASSSSPPLRGTYISMLFNLELAATLGPGRSLSIDSTGIN